jgi:hypothetical protein
LRTRRAGSRLWISSSPHRAGRGDASVGCHEAGARGAFPSPYSRARAIAEGLSRGRPSPVPPPCPKQRSATVASGHQRTAAMPAELRHRRSTGGPTVLPKLAVAHGPGPRWVRTASGTAGPGRARAVNVGESSSQVKAASPPRPRTAKHPGAGFESHPAAAAAGPGGPLPTRQASPGPGPMDDVAAAGRPASVAKDAETEQANRRRRDHRPHAQP